MSRDLKDLEPRVEKKVREMLEVAKFERFELLVYCTYRSVAEQARLYRKGRSIEKIHKKANELAEKYARPDLAEVLLSVGPQSGRIVTNAGPGQSMHNYGLAVDGVPIEDGKPVWGTKGEDLAKWQRYGKMAEAVGLEWAGRWKRFREFPHIQARDADWRTLIRGKSTR